VKVGLPAPPPDDVSPVREARPPPGCELVSDTRFALVPLVSIPRPLPGDCLEAVEPGWEGRVDRESAMALLTVALVGLGLSTAAFVEEESAERLGLSWDETDDGRMKRYTATPTYKTAPLARTNRLREIMCSSAGRTDPSLK
jgi:hypothetical protein